MPNDTDHTPTVHVARITELIALVGHQVTRLEPLHFQTENLDQLEIADLQRLLSYLTAAHTALAQTHTFIATIFDVAPE